MKGLHQSEVRAEILARLEKLHPGSPRQFGKMNPHQAICHLTDSFKAVAGQRTMSLPPMAAWQSAVLKWAALYLPIKWTTGIKTAPENDQQQQGSAPKDWNSDKAELLEWLEKFSSGKMAFVVHPLMGNLSAEEWQRWGYLHCDHHLRQFGV
jgi:hypothetical protein